MDFVNEMLTCSITQFVMCTTGWVALRCTEPLGHEGDHFDNAYMRSWSM